MSERDDITALKEAVLRLEALWRDLDKRLTAIENIKTTPEFRSMARAPGQSAPADWREVDMPGTL